MEAERKLETDLFHIGLVMLVCGMVLWAAYDFVLSDLLPQFPCVLYTLFGIYCPGCGGTRAFRALLRGRFLLSLWYHPLVPYMAAVGGGFLVTQSLHRMGLKCVKGWKFRSWYLYGAIFVVICNFLVKNALLLFCGIGL